MGESCSIAQMLAALEAKTSQKGLVEDNYEIQNYTKAQKLDTPDPIKTYERLMAKYTEELSVENNKKTPSKMAGKITAYLKENGYETDDSLKAMARGMMTPDIILPKNVHAPIDAKIRAWVNTEKPKFDAQLVNINKTIDGPQRQNALEGLRKRTQASYKEQVAKPLQAQLDRINKAFDPAGDFELTSEERNAAVQSNLKALNLDQRNVYYTREYLKHLVNGGPFFDFNPGGGSKFDPIGKTAHTLTRNKISYNPMTAIYNFSEVLQKGPAVFGMRNFAKGFTKAMERNPFEQHADLKAKGVYDRAFDIENYLSKFDPVRASQNFLENIAYYVGEAAGDPQRGLREIAYKTDPWNQSFMYVNPVAKMTSSFMRFQYLHFQQYGGWIKDLGNPKRAAHAAKSLIYYSAAASVVFGTKAAIPTPLYLLMKAANPDIDKETAALDKALGTNLVQKATGLDLGTKAQPLGGIAVGIGTDMLNTAFESANLAPKVVTQVQKGRVDKAAVVAVDSIVKLSQIHQRGANAFQQKLISGMAKAYLEDENLGGYIREVEKKLFGKDAVPAKPKSGSKGYL